MSLGLNLTRISEMVFIYKTSTNFVDIHFNITGHHPQVFFVKYISISKSFGLGKTFQLLKFSFTYSVKNLGGIRLFFKELWSLSQS